MATGEPLKHIIRNTIKVKKRFVLSYIIQIIAYIPIHVKHISGNSASIFLSSYHGNQFLSQAPFLSDGSSGFLPRRCVRNVILHDNKAKAEAVRITSNRLINYDIRLEQQAQENHNKCIYG